MNLFRKGQIQQQSWLELQELARVDQQATQGKRPSRPCQIGRVSLQAIYPTCSLNNASVLAQLFQNIPRMAPGMLAMIKPSDAPLMLPTVLQMPPCLIISSRSSFSKTPAKRRSASASGVCGGYCCSEKDRLANGCSSGRPL